MRSSEDPMQPKIKTKKTQIDPLYQSPRSLPLSPIAHSIQLSRESTLDMILQKIRKKSFVLLPILIKKPLLDNLKTMAENHSLHHL